MMRWLLENEKTIKLNGFGRIYFALSATMLTASLVSSIYDDIVASNNIFAQFFFGGSMLFWLIQYGLALKLLIRYK